MSLAAVGPWRGPFAGGWVYRPSGLCRVYCGRQPCSRSASMLCSCVVCHAQEPLEPLNKSNVELCAKVAPVSVCGACEREVDKTDFLFVGCCVVRGSAEKLCGWRVRDVVWLVGAPVRRSEAGVRRARRRRRAPTDWSTYSGVRARASNAIASEIKSAHLSRSLSQATVPQLSDLSYLSSFLLRSDRR